MNELRDGSPNHDPLEDDFILALIDSVQRNPCVYNRYDPLHKVTDYKHEIWKMISIEIGYDGQPVELERKWKHMRDKYVRLRKQDKQKAPIKPTNKWYNYYHKMSFLDPYVEHRNRKRQKDYIDNGSPDLLDDEPMFLEELSMKDILKHETPSNDLGYGSPRTTSSTSSGGNNNGRNLDSPIEETDEEKKRLILIYDKIIAENHPENNNGHQNGNGNSTADLVSTVSSDWSSIPANEQRSSRKRKPIPIQILPESPPPPPEKIIRQESLEDPLKEIDEDQVTFFIRSISKTLVEMDRKKFAMARIEISKVLYNIEFGKIQYSNDGPM